MKLYSSETQSQRGGVLLEAAFALSFLILIADGVISYGSSIIHMGDVIGAASAGARVASSYIIPEALDDDYANEDLVGITTTAVHQYLSAAGHDPRQFYIKLEVFPLLTDEQQGVQVSVTKKPQNTLLGYLPTLKICSSAFFMRETDERMREFQSEEQRGC